MGSSELRTLKRDPSDIKLFRKKKKIHYARFGNESEQITFSITKKGTKTIEVDLMKITDSRGNCQAFFHVWL